MSLRHLGGDRWQVAVSEGSKEQRRWLTKVFRAAPPTASGAPSREAKRIATEIEAELLARTRHGADNATVDNLMTQWVDHLQAQGRAMTTIARQDRIVRRIRQDLGRRQVRDLRGWDCDRWLADLAAGGMTRATVHHYGRILRAALRQAAKWGIIPAAPPISLPTVERHELDMMTPAAMWQTVQAAGGWLGVAARIAWNTGMRRGEVCALHWSDIEGSTIHVRRSLAQVGSTLTSKPPKTMQRRDIEVDERFIGELLEWRDRMAEAMRVTFKVRVPREWPVVCQVDSTGVQVVQPDSLTHAWLRHCASEGVVCRFHDLRHMHATLLLGAGVPLPDVAARLGHAKATTTLGVYAHALPSRGREAVEVFARAVAALPAG